MDKKIYENGLECILCHTDLKDADACRGFPECEGCPKSIKEKCSQRILGGAITPLAELAKTADDIGSGEKAPEFIFIVYGVGFVGKETVAECIAYAAELESEKKRFVLYRRNGMFEAKALEAIQ